MKCPPLLRAASFLPSFGNDNLLKKVRLHDNGSVNVCKNLLIRPIVVHCRDNGTA